MMAYRTTALTLILTTALVWALYALGADTPVRAVLALAWLLVAPGWAVMSLLGLAQRWAAAVLAVAFSLGMATVVSTALLLANAWTPGRALAIIGGMTLLAAGARLMIPAASPGPVVTASADTDMERREHGS